MRVHTEEVNPTKLSLTVTADVTDLNPLKDHVLGIIAPQVKVPGFRAGKAPLALVEKNADPATLQSEFLEEAVNHLYSTVVEQQKIRPVERPSVQIVKFVPFTDLEFTAEVNVIGHIKLADYTKIKKSLPKFTVTAKDVTDVLDTLRQRAAERKAVDRAAKDGDEVVIDFVGKDAKGQPVAGADGKDYPLILGSNSFIPGFEQNLVEVKPGEEKAFTLTFPKDYGVTSMQNKKVTFTVTVKKVQSLEEPKADDAFAAQLGPFKSIEELKQDIKKQVTQERQIEARRQFENELVQEIIQKSTVQVPDSLADEQIELLLRELQQNVAYRGQTFAEFLKQEGKTEKAYRQDVLRPQAEDRVKAGLILSEIAEKEQLIVEPEELEQQMAILKTQYKDEAMQTELAKPEARRDIASRILTQKTLDRLVEISNGKKV